jgi:hypothetical protein
MDPIIGLDVAGLAGVRADADLGAKAERLELALERSVRAFDDISDGRH